MIKFKAVRKSFPVGEQTIEILHGLDFNVGYGEFVGFLGRSGSGKSTTMNIVGLLDRPTSGQYYLDGQDVGGLDRKRKAQIRNEVIGFVFQQFLLLPRMTVIENVCLPLLYGGVSHSLAQKRAREVLDMVNMVDYEKARPSTLSGGQQQRIAIARALVAKPKLILADEPTGALDVENGQAVMKVLRRFNQELNVTVFMITHDQELAEQADRTFHLVDGSLAGGIDGH